MIIIIATNVYTLPSEFVLILAVFKVRHSSKFRFRNMYPEYLAYLWIPRSFFHPHTPQSLVRISIWISAKSCDSFCQVIMADLSHEGSYIYGRLVVLWFLSKSGSSRYSWNSIVASVNSVMASTSSISNPTLCWTYNLSKYQSSSFCFSLSHGIVGITSTEAARGIAIVVRQ